MHYFSVPIFGLFSYLKNDKHNLVIELCRAPFPPKTITQVFIKLTHSYVAIELLAFSINTKNLFFVQERSHYFSYINDFPYEDRGP